MIPTASGMFTKRRYTKLMGQIFDLKVAHKSRTLPRRIEIRSFNKTGIFIGSKHFKNAFGVIDIDSGRVEFRNYYEISRYYLGRDYSRVRINLVTPATNVSINQLYNTKYNVLNQIKQRRKK
jgi:hypothetical protein